MCRNIKPLFNFAPPATPEEIGNASLQFVRKVSGSTKPSAANAVAFERAVTEVTQSMTRLLEAMVTTAPAKDRVTEAAKARARSAKWFDRPAAGRIDNLR